MEHFYSDADIESLKEEARREGAASAGAGNAAAFARGVSTERERIKGVLTGPDAERDPSSAIMLALSGLDPTPTNLAAMQEARSIAAAASWDEIVEGLNARGR